MFAKLSSTIATGAAVALVLGAGLAYAQSADVAPVRVSGAAPTSVMVNTTGRPHAAVRQLVRVASVQVCGNAISNHELSWADEDWCEAATLTRSMEKFRRLRAAASHQVAAGPQILSIATR
jgi:hypothetical protein